MVHSVAKALTNAFDKKRALTTKLTNQDKLHLLPRLRVFTKSEHPDDESGESGNRPTATWGNGGARGAIAPLKPEDRAKH
jgi:hypothetical protein